MNWKIEHILHIVTACVLLCIAASCDSGDNDRSQEGDLDRQFTDSINVGAMEGALKIAGNEKQQGIETGDSDIYYRGMVHQAIVNYYAGRPQDMLRQVDSIAAYVASKPDNDLRKEMRRRTYSIKGGFYTRYQYNPDSNIYYYHKALEGLDEKEAPDITSVAYCNLAGAYRSNGKFDISADYYSRGAHIADSANLKPSYKILSYLGLAITYTDMRDFDQSRIWWNRAETYWQDMNLDDKFNYLNNRGHDFYEQRRYNESLIMFQRLDSLLKANPSLEWEANFCRANMTDVYLKIDQPDKAEKLILQTERYFTEVQPNAYIQEHIRTQKLKLGTIRGEYDKVSQMLDLWNATGIESRPEQKVERLEFLKDYYAGTGQWQKAYKAHIDYTEYEDSIRSEAQRLSMSERQMRYERDARILELCKDLEMHRKLQARNLVIGIIGVIVIALLIVVIVMMRRMSSHREERMLHRIIALRLESLRARINPHFVYNILNHEIVARQNGQPSHLDALVRLMRRQQYMADTLSVTLQEDLAFIDDYIKVESESMEAKLNYTCHIASDINPEKIRVPSMVLQIFVENAFKHGFRSLPEDQERILMVRVYRVDKGICLEVLNNAAADAAPSPDSTRRGLKIVMGTLNILNEKKRDEIRCEVGKWTDNPQHDGYRAAIIIPADFNFDIHGKN